MSGICLIFILKRETDMLKFYENKVGLMKDNVVTGILFV
jgi:hypothetical protein